MLRDNRGLYAAYRRHLPPLADYEAADFGQGFTPLVRSRRLGPRYGVDHLYFKLETLNPSGSYKDRFAGLALALAREAGAKTCLATSSGNTGAAIAAAAAHLGMTACLFVNEFTPAGKLVQMQAHGARLFRVKGMGVDAGTTAGLFQDLSAVSAHRSVPLLVSAFAISPLGMAGIQTIAYELAEQLDQIDHVFCPVGGGGLYNAVARGFADLSKEGQTAPHVHMVQPRLNDTVVTPLVQGWTTARAVGTTTTLSGLAVPIDLDGTACIERARECGGRGILTEDSDALAAQADLMVTEGLLSEPAGALSVAGFIRAAQEGWFAPEDRVVCVLTGHAFKEMTSFEAVASRSDVETITRAELMAVTADIT